QIARRNYPNYSAGFSLNIPIRNRAAQSDYVTSMLELRQNELNLQKSVNQIRVDVQNAVIGLRQARARYDAAVKARVLQQQTLDGDQQKYKLGASTVYQVVQDQRDLATAESAEVQSLANYSHARIAFDQALGVTLEVNSVSNSGRLRDLIRAGTLYLTAQDAIALALENNIDLEVARYNPILSVWQLRRAQAGGALPGVPSGASQAGSVASGQGVAGSQ